MIEVKEVPVSPQALPGTTRMFEARYGSVNGSQSHIALTFGIVPVSYLGNHAYLWAIAYLPIPFEVLRDAKRAAAEFFSREPWSFSAACDNPVGRRFLEFFDFRQIQDRGNIIYFWRGK